MERQRQCLQASILHENVGIIPSELVDFGYVEFDDK